MSRLRQVFATTTTAGRPGEAVRRNVLQREGIKKSPFLPLPEDAGVPDCDGMLRQLSRRLCCEADFPHEIGVFLGYPLTDVVGFIENQGRNFTCCGCWKGCAQTRLSHLWRP